jgi:hypothetical protein
VSSTVAEFVRRTGLLATRARGRLRLDVGPPEERSKSARLRQLGPSLSADQRAGLSKADRLAAQRRRGANVVLRATNDGDG